MIKSMFCIKIMHVLNKTDCCAIATCTQFVQGGDCQLISGSFWIIPKQKINANENN